MTMRRVVFIGVMLVCMLCVGSASAYLAGYGYYQDVTLNNTGSNLTNYQMMFVVNTSSGTSSSTTIYLNSHANASLNDLRFTSTSDTVYDYWIESTSNPYNVWVEVPSILAGNSTMRVQYGNAAASAVSNGTNTFPFFDDFPGSSLDGVKWSSTGSPTVSISSGILTLTAGNGKYLQSISTHANNLVCRFRTADVGGYETVQQGFGLKSTSFTVPMAARDNYDGTRYNFQTQSGSARTYDGILTRDTNYHIYEVKRISTTSCTLSQDGTLKSTITTNLPGTNAVSIYLGAASGGAATTKSLIDFVLIRLYTATEPTVPAWSGESPTSAAPTAAFSANRTTGAPGDVAFTDASTNTPTSWAWSFGDGTANGTTQNPTHTYAAGTFTVTLTATNADGSDGETKVDYITLTTPPVAAFHANVTSGYVPLSVGFTDDSTNTPTSWAWSFDDGGANSTSQNPTRTFSSAGTYNITLTATNAGGSDGETKIGYITVNPPLAKFPGCADYPADLDADGLYEDINGNGRKDWADIIMFFNECDWARVNQPAPAFDWNGNGIIDYADVYALYAIGV